MAAIRSLLNPLPEGGEQRQLLLAPISTNHSVETSPQVHARKKQKTSKDVAIFNRGALRGECRFPPCEQNDKVVAALHQQYELHPKSHIADFPRHIPYSSEKKSFWEKTGRDSFEVFQYEFKIPGDDKVYCMMWDYNIGLVRTTPLFKCSGYSKTTPAKMLNRNPGLRDICHSITGGALVAQGYWIPYEAAKAVAATFCWSIRYALTPVFGLDFPSQCIQPGSVRFGDMVIDIEVTRRCTEQAKMFRLMETRTSSRGPSVMRSPLTPVSPFFRRINKQFRPKALKLASNANGYATDTSTEDNYMLSPRSSNPYRNTWTALNTPRSPVTSDARLPSPREILAKIAARSGNASDDDGDMFSDSNSPPISPKTRRVAEVDGGYDGDSSTDSSLERLLPTSFIRRRNVTPDTSDEKAAHLLMSLSMERSEPSRSVRGKKRRASARW